ncbi:MAG TPA: hypothetical protein GX517_02965, partial [Alicyclobacillus sp.]|nr:hypothetical protein [Alicyclobacillus sp.]
MSEKRSFGRTEEELRFLARVANALGREVETSPPEQPVRGVRGLPTPEAAGNSLEQFLANWRAVGGEADVVRARE